MNGAAFNVGIAFTGRLTDQSIADPDLPDCDPVPGESITSSEIQGRLKALDVFRANLSEVTLWRCYSNDRLVTPFVDHDCDPDQPAVVIHWNEDDCGRSLRDGSVHTTASAYGSFSATVVRPFASLNMPSDHTITVELEGRSTREIERCSVSPNSIRGIVATIRNPYLPFVTHEFRVRFDCIYDARPVY